MPEALILRRYASLVVVGICLSIVLPAAAGGTATGALEEVPPAWLDPPEIVPIDGGEPGAVVQTSSEDGPLGIGTLGLWGMAPADQDVVPRSPPAFSKTSSSWNDDWFIFWMYDFASATYVLCDNHPYYEFSDHPDGHASISFATVPIDGVEEPLQSGLLQGDGLTCAHAGAAFEGVKDTYRVTTPGICDQSSCSPVGNGLAGEFSLYPV